MRMLLIAGWMALTGATVAADPPGKRAEPPHAVLEFLDSPKDWNLTLKMTTESGAVYELPVDLSDGNAFRYMTQIQLIRANWMAELSGDRSITIYGVRTRTGNADAVQSLVITTRVRRGMGQTPRLSQEGGVKVEARTDDSKEPPAAIGKRLTGPDLGEEPYVEFDFAPLPQPPGIRGRYTLRVETETAFFEKQVGGVIRDHDDVAFLWEVTLNGAGFKSEVVGRSNLRVYGAITKGRFHPATQGKVESEDLTKAQLPTVTRPKLKG